MFVLLFRYARRVQIVNNVSSPTPLFCDINLEALQLKPYSLIAADIPLVAGGSYYKNLILCCDTLSLFTDKALEPLARVTWRYWRTNSEQLNSFSFEICVYSYNLLRVFVYSYSYLIALLAELNPSQPLAESLLHQSGTISGRAGQRVSQPALFRYSSPIWLDSVCCSY